NSTLTAGLTVNIINGSSSNLEVYQGATDKGASGNSGASLPFTMNKCSRVLVRNINNVIIDSFIQPASSTVTLNRRYYSVAGTCTLNFTNNSANNTIAIYDDGFLIG